MLGAAEQSEDRQHSEEQTESEVHNEFESQAEGVNEHDDIIYEEVDFDELAKHVAEKIDSRSKSTVLICQNHKFCSPNSLFSLGVCARARQSRSLLRARSLRHRWEFNGRN